MRLLENTVLYCIILPFLVYFLTGFLLYLLLAVVGKIPGHDQEMLKRGHSLLLGRHLKQAFVWTLRPWERFFLKQKANPDHLTLLSVMITMVGAVILAMGSLFHGTMIMAIGSLFDYLDGRIARGLGKAGKAGSFLDSSLDRYADALMLGAAGFLFRNQPVLLTLSMSAMAASLIISYTRAKAESLGHTLTIGLMQRPERIVIYCLTAVLSGPCDRFLPAGLQNTHAIFALGITVLSITCVFTAIHRTLTGYQKIKAADENALK